MNGKITHMRNRRCLVAGGGGFIGRRVVDRLLDLGAGEVVILERTIRSANERIPRVKYISCDLSHADSRDIIDNAGPFDYVFNLVGTTDQRMPHPNPSELFDANVRTLMHLTQGIAWKHVRGAVFTGTNAEYGAAPLVHKESLVPASLNMYGWSKAAATFYAMTMTRQGFAKWCVVRPFFVYGPGQHRGFIPELIKTLAADNIFELSSDATRDPVYVDDVAEGLIRLAACPRAQGEVVNICGGKEVPIRRIAEIVLDKMKKGGVVVKLKPQPGDMARSRGSLTKLKDLTHWSPSMSLIDGLQRVIESYKNI